MHTCIYIYIHSHDLPPGWGACGGPNDGWHGFFHGLRRSAMRMRVGMGDVVELRKCLLDLSIAVDGNYRFELQGFV